MKYVFKIQQDKETDETDIIFSEIWIVKMSFNTYDIGYNMKEETIYQTPGQAWKEGSILIEEDESFTLCKGHSGILTHVNLQQF